MLLTLTFKEAFTLFGGTTLVSLILTGLWNFIFNSRRRRVKERLERSLELDKKFEETNKRINQCCEGLQAILRQDLANKMLVCISRGYKTQYEAKDIQDALDRYEPLGPNNYIDNLESEWKQLPTKALDEVTTYHQDKARDRAEIKVAMLDILRDYDLLDRNNKRKDSHRDEK
jgi:hypothetical protein